MEHTAAAQPELLGEAIRLVNEEANKRDLKDLQLPAPQPSTRQQ